MHAAGHSTRSQRQPKYCAPYVQHAALWLSQRSAYQLLTDGAAGDVQVVTAPAGNGGLDSSVLLNIGEQLRDENRYDRYRASRAPPAVVAWLHTAPPFNHNLLCVLLMSAWCRVTNPAALLC